MSKVGKKIIKYECTAHIGIIKINILFPIRNISGKVELHNIWVPDVKGVILQEIIKEDYEQN